MADVIFADCDLVELDAALGLTGQRQASDIPDEPRLLIQALAGHDVEATRAPWNDPETNWKTHRLCVLKRTWTHTRQPDAFLAWARQVAQHCDLWNPLAMIEWNLHKRYLLELAQRGVPIVPTELVARNDSTTVCEVADRRGWADIIIKPAISAGSIDIGRFQPEERAAQAHADRLLAARDILIQSYAPAIEQRGEISLVVIDGEFSHAFRKKPVTGDYRAQPHLGIELVEWDPSEREIEIAIAVLDAVPVMPLYARIDLVDFEGEPVLMEAELIDPYLFLDRTSKGLERLTRAIIRPLRDGG
jgi:glutathione synthase/RimK-type ligase-like ATP-grasp enzyme